MPTTDLDIDASHPSVVEGIHSCHPSFMWTGVFGWKAEAHSSVPISSDVDIVVGYSPDADFFVDVCRSVATFQG
jgi:hypothetical protein